jgi:hypothetical protein
MTVKSLRNFRLPKSGSKLIFPDQAKLFKYKAIRINYHGRILGIFAVIARKVAPQ